MDGTMEMQLLLFPDFKPPGPTMTWARDRGDRIREGIHELARLIPYLEHPHPRAPSTRGGRTVPLDFIRTMVGAVRHTPEGGQVTDVFDADDAELMLQCRADLYGPVADELEALLRAVRHTSDAWKARVAGHALAMFFVLKGLARKQVSHDLLTWIATLTDDLGRKGARRKKRQE